MPCVFPDRAPAGGLRACAGPDAHATLRHGAPVAMIDGQHVELADIKSQYHAKRALEIAVGGGHNLLILCSLLRYLAP
jgi:hypothetical protein